jgi:hypothetical protein
MRLRSERLDRAAATLLVGWTWTVIARMDPQRTKSRAAHEDPTHFATVLFVVIASREPRGC